MIAEKGAARAIPSDKRLGLQVAVEQLNDERASF